MHLHIAWDMHADDPMSVTLIWCHLPEKEIYARYIFGNVCDEGEDPVERYSILCLLWMKRQDSPPVCERMCIYHHPPSSMTRQVNNIIIISNLTEKKLFSSGFVYSSQ